MNVRLSIADGQALANAALLRLGFDAEEAAIATSHLIDAELRGLGYAGFGRLVSIAEQSKKRGRSQQPVKIVKETPVSAQLDGGDRLGLIVAQRATDIAIAKAQTSGIAVVGASNTWYTGMLSYYAEQPAARDMVAMVASNATARVAPYGGNERRMGANPICFGFPSVDEPVVWDIGTSAVGHAQAKLAKRLDRLLEEGVAFDADGRPTTDPSAALAGAFAAWGGHRGSGLGIVVQLLGMLAGSPMLPGELQDFGFLIVAVQPGLLTTLDEFKKSVADYSAIIRATRPIDPGKPLRMPFDRSRAERNVRTALGVLEVPDAIHAAVVRVAVGH
jgi:delta1-piperideine-2-carboxylate reductase